MLERVCQVDPEDVQMHYTAMLCYRGLGDTEKAAREEKLFRRFKADESVAGDHRQAPHASAPRTTTSASRSTSTRARPVNRRSARPPPRKPARRRRLTALKRHVRTDHGRESY